MFVYHTAHWCQTSWHSCTLSSVFWSLQTGASERGCARGTSIALHCNCTRNWVQKSRACAFEESGSGEINLCDLAVLGEIWLESGAEVLQRAVQTGTGSAPTCLSLGLSVDKTPLVKECWEWCKKRVYNMRGSRTWGQITINRIMPECCWFSSNITYVNPWGREVPSKENLFKSSNLFYEKTLYNLLIFFFFTVYIFIFFFKLSWTSLQIDLSWLMFCHFTILKFRHKGTCEPADWGNNLFKYFSFHMHKEDPLHMPK